ncbi:MAG: hypothetical protein FJW44_09840 [Actinobacteria bacterium]|nr:hypothetical protein [Actinomycetota bacterium]
MRTKRRVLAATASLALLAACGGGGGGGGGGESKAADITVPEAKGVSVDLGLAPNPDGFAFANFGAGASPEVFGAEDLVAMFGSGADVCVEGTDPCQPTAEAAAWAAMVNDNRAAGHCEGFAVLSANRFAAGKTPPSVQLTMDPTVTKDIMRAFATQFLQSTQDETLGWQGKSLKDKVATLESAFASKKAVYTLAIYTTEGGHAVLPYAIEYLTPEQVKIKIYDSNWPGQDRFVMVDLANETWTFAYSGADPNNDPAPWSGGPKDLDITSMSARDAGKIPFGKGNGEVTKSLLLIRSAALNWSIDTPTGTLAPGQPSTAGASIRPVRSSAPKAPGAPVDYMVYVPSNQKLQFNLPDATRVAGITPKAAIRIETPGSKKGKVEVIDGGVKANDPSVVLSLADGNLVASSNGAGNEIATTGGQIDVRLTAPNGEQVSVAVTADTPAVDVRTPGRDGVDPNANVEILSQTGANEIEKKVIDASGNETVTTQQGQLENTQVNRPMPEALAAPATKPGLPSRDERVAQVTPAAGTPTTIDASAPTTTPLGDPTATTAIPPATAPAGGGNLPPLRPVATVPGG